MCDVVHDGPGLLAHSALSDREIVDAVEKDRERLEKTQRQHQPVHAEQDRTPVIEFKSPIPSKFTNVSNNLSSNFNIKLFIGFKQFTNQSPLTNAT